MSPLRLMFAAAVCFAIQSLLGGGLWAAPQADSDFAKDSCERILEHKKSNNGSAKKCSEILHTKDVRKHVGEIATVEFLVDNTHECRKGHVYLNESKDYKTCFAAVIAAASRKEFPSDAAKEYSGKKVRVTGKIEIYGGTPKIILDEPSGVQVMTD